jgi:hypothetical protein|tara:strand:- start:6841 stop:7599 length:759 start_codon:yes stop_codon:yes gene_type:complete
MDVATWESFPEFEELRATCKELGVGKYVLFERGQGIRGMRKVNEVFIEAETQSVINKTHSQGLEELLVFAAEELGVAKEAVISMRTETPLGKLSDTELVNILDKMVSSKDIKSAEELESVMGNIKSVIGEVKKRGMSSEGYSAETAQMAISDAESKGSLGKGMTFGAGLLVGGLGGVAATAYHYKGKIEDMETRMAAMESSMKETETELKAESEKRKREQRSAEAVAEFDRNLGIDNAFLSHFNRQNPANQL